MAGSDLALPEDVVTRIVREALEEDIGPGDATTEVLVPPGIKVEATLTAQSPGVLAGVPVTERIYRMIGADIAWTWKVREGERFDHGSVLCHFSGDAALIVTGERVALNFLQRLSGIASVARRYADAMAGTGTTLLDTRKTTPLLRGLEKYAVRVGGGENHRYGLYDRILIKDNHLAVVTDPGEAVRRAQEARPDLLVEVEVSDMTEYEQALAARPDWILLDNMTIQQLTDCVARRNGAAPPRPQLEASGGITLETIGAIAETGIDAVSVGALTHSAPWCDISLEVSM